MPKDELLTNPGFQEEYQVFLARIDDLITSGEFDWALDTLEGIQETVQKTHYVTKGQERAVTNIATRGGRDFERF
jgi:hypothetical protein